MKPHKHAEVIKAWADGEKIQYRNEISNPYWTDMPICSPNWHEDVEYRVKPDEIRYLLFSWKDWFMYNVPQRYDNGDYKKNQIRLVFDGKTGNLDSVELIK